MAKAFGLGAPTGIPYLPEAGGVVPDPAWKLKTFGDYWATGDAINLSIGQGFLQVTPLQLANALATVVNGGRMFRPHVVRQVVDAGSGARRVIEPEPIRDLGLAPRHLAAVRAAMVEVNRSGTGARAFRGAAYTVGGKTGTAQVFSLRGQRYVAGRVAERLRDHSWFIAFAPAEEPRIALAVLVENGGFGAQSAAPIARQVIDYYLLHARAEQPAAEDAEAAGDTE